MSYLQNKKLLFSPNHLIDHTGITLNEFHNLGADNLIGIVGDGNTIVSVLAHFYRHVYSLKKVVFVDTSQYEAAFIQGFWAFRTGSDADGWETMTHTGEETAFLGQCSAVGHYRKGIHLQAIVIMEAKGLVLDDTRIQLEAACGQTVAASRMAAVKDGHVVLLCHLVNGCKEAVEVLLCIYVLFTVGTEEDVFALL